MLGYLIYALIALVGWLWGFGGCLAVVHLSDRAVRPTVAGVILCALLGPLAIFLVSWLYPRPRRSE